MASNGDPFLQVQSDVLSTLDTCRPLFASYLRIRSTAPSASSPELAQARSELEAHLQTLAADLRDLLDSVRAVEQDPFRYGLDVDEVARRRRLVDAVGGEVADMRDELGKVVATGPDGGGGGSGGGLPDPAAFEDREEGGDGVAAMEQQRQVEMLREQDQALDGVFQTVGTLREQADVMGRELEEQGEILGEVDTLADRVGGKLTGGVRKMNEVIRRNEDKWSSCCIGVLIFVLILLLILVIAI